MAKELTAANFETEVLASKLPVLVDFWASWCGPCQMLSPLVEEIAEERTDISVGKVNVDEQSALAFRYGIDAIPCLILFKDGAIAARTEGYMPKETLLQTLGL